MYISGFLTIFDLPGCRLLCGICLISSHRGPDESKTPRIRDSANKNESTFLLESVTYILRSAATAVLGLLRLFRCPMENVKLPLLLLAFLTVLTAAKAQCRANHTVQLGENLSVIAEDFETTLTAVLAVNEDIENRDVIFPGQVICIPGKLQPTPPTGCSDGFEGKATAFNVEAGLTACEESFSGADLVAALSFQDFGDADPPRDSESCQKCARVCGPNGTVVVKISDKCTDCEAGDISLTLGAFRRGVGEPGTGKALVRWTFVDCS